MSKVVLFAAALLAATPAFAADTQLHFSRDGQTYEATLKQKVGYTLVVGRNLTSGEAFSLRVANGEVRGAFAGQPVAFSSAADPATAVAAN